MITMLDNPWDLFPQHRHLGTEEAGNEIVVDTSAGQDGPVMGLWHDPPAIVVLARNEQEFRKLAPRFGGDEATELPKPVHDNLDSALKWSKTNLLSCDDAGPRLGSQFADWLSSLPTNSVICDLRAAKPGTGFEYDASSSFARHPAAAVFACHTPPAKPGFFKRLFGASK